MTKTLVLQSHRDPLPHAWLAACIESVKQWCQTRGFHHEFICDELFDYVPPGLLAKTESQRVIATDLARLRALQSYLERGFDCVVWCDADFLIFRPDSLVLPDTSYALGREVWIQAHASNARKLTAHVKVHNAFLMFREGNPFLAFYADTAERLVSRNEGRMPPQFVGPKLLSAIHNASQCPVLETAGMLSPLVLKDIADGGGPALELFRRRSSDPLAAANLCSSRVERGEIAEAVIEACLCRLRGNDAIV